MDLGASWIHGTEGNPIAELADQADAKWLPTSYERAMSLDGSGAEVDLSEADVLTDPLARAAHERAEKPDADQSREKAITSLRGWKDLDAGAQGLVRHVLNGSVLAEYGGAPAEVSAWFHDESDEFDGGDVLFPGGYDQIVRYLAEGLEIRTAQIVTAITPEGDGAAVTLADGRALAEGGPSHSPPYAAEPLRIRLIPMSTK